MGKVKCNSCGAVYIPADRGGPDMPHVCPHEIIEFSTWDQETGKQLTPEKRSPRPNIRDERTAVGAMVVNGKWVTRAADPNDTTKVITTEHAARPIMAEGLGTTPVEE